MATLARDEKKSQTRSKRGETGGAGGGEGDGRQDTRSPHEPHQTHLVLGREEIAVCSAGRVLPQLVLEGLSPGPPLLDRLLVPPQLPSQLVRVPECLLLVLQQPPELRRLGFLRNESCLRAVSLAVRPAARPELSVEVGDLAAVFVQLTGLRLVLVPCTEQPRPQLGLGLLRFGERALELGVLGPPLVTLALVPGDDGGQFALALVHQLCGNRRGWVSIQSSRVVR